MAALGPVHIEFGVQARVGPLTPRDSAGISWLVVSESLATSEPRAAKLYTSCFLKNHPKHLFKIYIYIFFLIRALEGCVVFVFFLGGS